MKKAVRLTLILLFSALPALAIAASQPLLTPDQLHAMASQDNLRIIDIRPAQVYEKGHIPGAISAPYSLWRGPSDNPGKLPSVEQLSALAQKLGLDKNSRVVVVHTGANSTAFGASARVYWTLKYIGLTQLSILNGGFKAWQEANLPEDQNTPKVAASHYQAQPNEKLIATTRDVAAQLGNKNVRLVDARPHDFYVGKTKSPVVSKPGTIKGADNLENSEWFKPDTAIFVSAEQAKQIAQQKLNGSAQETISFCNTGHWAATDWFALSEVVGLDNVRLYPQSMVAWASDNDLPMQNVPSRGQQLLNKVKGVFK